MANKMLIDASHAEETRVAVVRGNRVEEFDFESAQRKQLRGNIYLAKVTRVEPSLQAAFVDYGGNRHGFLAFSEIHPDYYQIPVADRQALLEEEARYAEERANSEERGDRNERGGGGNRGRKRRGGRRFDKRSRAAGNEAQGETVSSEEIDENLDLETNEGNEVEQVSVADDNVTAQDDATDFENDDNGSEDTPVETNDSENETADENSDDTSENAETGDTDETDAPREEETIEAVGGADAMEEVDRPRRFAPRRYKIQEVIKRRQVILVQVVKEERGNKGAALTTYLSLAGRYSVLMPNTARGGGISRKINNAADRARLKEIATELEVPDGMGMIIRTAGASRTKPEVKRDFEYLMRLWESVADLTLKSQAPSLVYEEGSLIKRAIRDLYNKDIDDVIVSGETAHREAKDFMGMLMPSHIDNVISYEEPVPLFSKFGVESQLEQMFNTQVNLKSGGYIVINQAEALVAIDVNSGRSTREHNIEDTALRTNIEAAEEIARQLRLRDLAGLIVIDFIDMEEHRNNRTVERKIKDALKQDRARIQVGRISHFGLLEMSRQRLRASVFESTTETCPVCNGAGHVRNAASSALQILRLIEERLLQNSGYHISIRTRTPIALYVLNHKRGHLRELEERFGVTIVIDADNNLPAGTPFLVERGGNAGVIQHQRRSTVGVDSVDVSDIEMDESEEQSALPNTSRTPQGEERGEDGQPRRKRRRRGRRSGNGREFIPRGEEAAPAETATINENETTEGSDSSVQPSGEQPSFRGRGRGHHRNAEEQGSDRPARTPRRKMRGGRDHADESNEQHAPAAAVKEKVSASAEADDDTPPQMPRIPELPDVGDTGDAKPTGERKGWWSKKILGG
ncbi:MAG: Rne/Rng family ribonuclease [Pseudomonadota bacterium]